MTITLLSMFVLATILIAGIFTAGPVAFADKEEKDDDKVKTLESICAKKLDKKNLNLDGLFCLAIISIQATLVDLQSQIDTIQLIPGPQGPAGTNGKDGADGAGLSCDNQNAINAVISGFTVDEECLPIPTEVTLFALGTNVDPLQDCHSSAPCDYTVEIVDLNTLTTITSFPVATNTLIDFLEVTPDGQSIYIPTKNNEILVFSSTGLLKDTIPINSPGDMVLSSDGSTLYVIAQSNSPISNPIIATIDTKTNTITNSFQNDKPMMSIAISTDDQTLAVTLINTGLDIIDTSSLIRDFRVTTGDSTFSPKDVIITDTGIALVWDSNRDKISQFDITTGTLLSSHMIQFPVDFISIFDSNILQYSPLNDEFYLIRENGELIVSDPVTLDFQQFSGFNGIPRIPHLSPDQSSLFISIMPQSSTSSDTLDKFDTNLMTINPNVFTFSENNFHVIDMQIIG